MLLTFPTKQSLLRKIQESSLDQKYLILSDYKKLADWNLIPLSELTVLLGPNSSGKSSVCEALDALNILKDGIRLNSDDNRIDNLYDARREIDGKGNSSSVIGFSGPFPNIEGSLKNFITSHLEAIDYSWDYEKNLGFLEEKFSFLSRIFEDKTFKKHLSETTYTFIVENITDENLDISVYLDGILAAEFQYDNYVDSLIKFDLKFIDFFIKESSLSTNLALANYQSGPVNIRFTTKEDWRSFSELPKFIFNNTLRTEFPFDIDEQILNEVFGLLVLLFHAPITTILNNFRQGSTNDVRALSSNWSFLRQNLNIINIKEMDDYLARKDFHTLGNEDFPENLIVDQVNVYLSKYKENESTLFRLNRWLSEPAFMGTEYEVVVYIKACMALDEFGDNFSLKDHLIDISNRTHSNYSTVEFLGRVYLKDQQGRLLKFSQVGSGFSQIIPLLVDLTSDFRLAYKQPELHLHPKLQSKIADCFIEVVNSNSSLFDKSFRVIESHSEHFVLRLLRRVRESFRDELLHSSLTLNSKDLSLCYFKPIEDKTEVYQIRVSESGDFIDGWPEGFFDERDNEIWD